MDKPNTRAYSEEMHRNTLGSNLKGLDLSNNCGARASKDSTTTQQQRIDSLFAQPRPGDSYISSLASVNTQHKQYVLIWPFPGLSIKHCELNTDCAIHIPTS